MRAGRFDDRTAPCLQAGAVQLFSGSGTKVSAVKFIRGNSEIHTTPKMLPDGRFVVRATITELTGPYVEELWPDVDPFMTEAEASSAAHLAAVGWVSGRGAGS